MIEQLTWDETTDLEFRAGDGIEVTLLWAKAAGRVYVAVRNHSSGEGFEVEVRDDDSPMDVFRHPFDSLPPDEEVEWSSARPIDALEAASDEADLLVVGSSGLRGPRALGSVSERIGHLARCSVLIVREPPRGSGVESEIADEVPDPEC